VVVKNKLNNSYYHEQSVTLHLGYRCSRYDTYTGARVSRYDVITLLLIARAPHLTHSPVGRPRPVNDVGGARAYLVVIVKVMLLNLS